jgi:tetratricopeptide (TPR) repeat protein
LLERSRAELAGSNLPIPDWYVAQVDFWRGSVLTKSGEIGRAMPLLEAAAPALKRSLSTSSERWWFASEMGLAESMAGRHELADAHLRERLEARRQQGQGMHPWAVFDYAFVAENLVMQGRTREAEAALDEAPQFEPIRGEGRRPGVYNGVIPHTRALVRLIDGRAADALRILQSAPPAADDDDNAWGEYRALLGATLCATGQRIEGSTMLLQSIATEEQGGYFPYAPWLAHRRALAGLCAAESGDRALALRHATQARAAFAAQPGVSPYYKAPLFKLERALGLKLPPV